MIPFRLDALPKPLIKANSGLILFLLLLISNCSSPHKPTDEEITTVRLVRAEDGYYSLQRRDSNGLLHGRSIYFYPNHSIESIFYFKHDTLQGVQRGFYENGNLRLIQSFKDGYVQGLMYNFYKDGALKSRGYVLDTLHTGPFIEFYQYPRNRVMARAEYAVVNGKEWRNGYVLYDSLGRVTDRWGFPHMQAQRDTLALGDSLVLRLRVAYPKESLVLAGVGGFGKEFRRVDSTALRVTYGQNHAVTVRVPAIRRGPQVVRGYLADYKLNPTKREKGVTSALERRMYFAYPYYVR